MRKARGELPEVTVAHSAAALGEGDHDVALAETGMSWRRRVLLSPSLVLAIVICVFVLYGMSQSSAFINDQTWINILRDAVFIAIPAVFGTLVLVSGGLDLSVGSVFAAGAMLAAMLAQLGAPMPIAFLGGTLVGAAVGVVNGVLVNYLKITPIIVTLGTLFGVRALVAFLSQGNPIGPLPPNFDAIGQGELFGIPYVIYYAVIIGSIAYVLLHTTNFGWAVRAMGGNREAARSAGINVRRLSLVVFTLSGAAAALAGALQAARLGSGSPSLGQGLELEVIAAAIIGGTSIAGAIGTVPGTILGALLLSVLATGLVLLHIDPSLQEFFVGVALISAAALDQFRRRQMFRTSAKQARSLG